MKLTPELVQLAAEVGLQVLEVFQGEPTSESDAQLALELRQLSASISTVKGTQDFKAILTEYEKRKAEGEQADQSQPNNRPSDDEEIEGGPV